jgi:hypothetical protein
MNDVVTDGSTSGMSVVGQDMRAIAEEFHERKIAAVREEIIHTITNDVYEGKW